MCKILNIPKITDQNRENALAFIEKMAPLMSQGNRDGIGYAAIDASDALFGERWHRNDDFMKVRSISEMDKGLQSLFGDVLSVKLSVDHKYSSFGVGAEGLSSIKAITLHTRMATSGKEFKNTHPFVYEDQDTSLIHNGVIRNVGAFDLKKSTCDSESILISYLKHGVNVGLSNVQAMDDALNGYYAIGVFSRDDQGRRVMDVIKGPQANLYVVYIHELAGYVFSTNIDDVFKACDQLKFTCSTGVTLKEGSALRFIDGELVSVVTYKASASATMVYDYRGGASGNYQAPTKKNGTGGAITTTNLTAAHTRFKNGKKSFKMLA